MKFLTTLLFCNEDDLVDDQIKYYSGPGVFLKIFVNRPSENVLNELHKRGYSNGGKCTGSKGDPMQYLVLPDSLNFTTGQVHRAVYTWIQSVEKDFDWISFPESDEFLEGPDRTMTYYEHAAKTEYNTIVFGNFMFCCTPEDDYSIKSPVERIKYYTLIDKVYDRVYAWRGRDGGFTNLTRYCGHTMGKESTNNLSRWVSCHYHIRNPTEYIERCKTRLKVWHRRDSHYKIIIDKNNKDGSLPVVQRDQLHLDDGSEIKLDIKFDWRGKIHK